MEQGPVLTQVWALAAWHFRHSTWPSRGKQPLSSASMDSAFPQSWEGRGSTHWWERPLYTPYTPIFTLGRPNAFQLMAQSWCPHCLTAPSPATRRPQSHPHSLYPLSPLLPSPPARGRAASEASTPINDVGPLPPASTSSLTLLSS